MGFRQSISHWIVPTWYMEVEVTGRCCLRQVEGTHSGHWGAIHIHWGAIHIHCGTIHMHCIIINPKDGLVPNETPIIA